MAHNLIQDNEIKTKGQVIRDSRFMSKSVSNESSSSQDFIYNQNLEEKIAIAYDKNDILQLASILINIKRDSHFIKKAKNSPLYVYRQKDSIQDEITLTQTAMYLLINDNQTNIDEITKAYNLLNNLNVLDKSNNKLRKTFEDKLGIADSIKRKNSILDKLKEARSGLGFL